MDNQRLASKSRVQKLETVTHENFLKQNFMDVQEGPQKREASKGMAGFHWHSIAVAYFYLSLNFLELNAHRDSGGYCNVLLMFVNCFHNL